MTTWAELPGRSLAVEVPASSANLGAGYDCLGLALELTNRVDGRGVRGRRVDRARGDRRGRGRAAGVAREPVRRGAGGGARGVAGAAAGVDRLADRDGTTRSRCRAASGRRPPPRSAGSSPGTRWPGRASTTRSCSGSRRPSSRTPTTPRRCCWAGSWSRRTSATGRGGPVRRTATACARCCSSPSGGSRPRTCAASCRPRSRTGTPSATSAGSRSGWPGSRPAGWSCCADLTVDRLHEPYRSVAYPELPHLTGAARAAGALGAFLSGARVDGARLRRAGRGSRAGRGGPRRCRRGGGAGGSHARSWRPGTVARW